jgi:hypothetical protein
MLIENGLIIVEPSEERSIAQKIVCKANSLVRDIYSCLAICAMEMPTGIKSMQSIKSRLD